MGRMDVNCMCVCAGIYVCGGGKSINKILFTLIDVILLEHSHQSWSSSAAYGALSYSPSISTKFLLQKSININNRQIKRFLRQKSTSLTQQIQITTETKVIVCPIPCTESKLMP